MWFCDIPQNLRFSQASPYWCKSVQFSRHTNSRGSQALLRIRLTDSIKWVKLKEIYWVAVHQGLYETERRGVNGLAQRWTLMPTTSWLIELNVHVTSRIPLIAERRSLHSRLAFISDYPKNKYPAGALRRSLCLGLHATRRQIRFWCRKYDWCFLKQ